MDDRFEIVSRQIFSYDGDSVEILRDKQTGVMYIYRCIASSGGLSVLVDKDGKPMTTFKVKI